MATFIPMTDIKRETSLKRVPCIQYSVRFYQKNKDKSKDIRVLINLGSKVNTIHPTYTTKLGLHARKIDVGLQKIDEFYLDTFKIMIANRSVKNKLEKIQFFQKAFLLANISLEVVLEMLFLTFSKADIWFTE